MTELNLQHCWMKKVARKEESVCVRERGLREREREREVEVEREIERKEINEG